MSLNTLEAARANGKVGHIHLDHFPASTRGLMMKLDADGDGEINIAELAHAVKMWEEKKRDFRNLLIGTIVLLVMLIITYVAMGGIVYHVLQLTKEVKLSNNDLTSTGSGASLTVSPNALADKVSGAPLTVATSQILYSSDNAPTVTINAAFLSADALNTINYLSTGNTRIAVAGWANYFDPTSKVSTVLFFTADHRVFQMTGSTLKHIADAATADAMKKESVEEALKASLISTKRLRRLLTEQGEPKKEDYDCSKYFSKKACEDDFQKALKKYKDELAKFQETKDRSSDYHTITGTREECVSNVNCVTEKEGVEIKPR